MAGPLDALNPVSGVLKLVRGIIGQFVEDPTKKAELSLQLVQAQADLEKALAVADQQVTDAKARVVIAETQSDSWIAKNWRPLTMLTFTFIVAWNFVAVPIFGATPTPFPSELWSLLELGIGGYIAARTAEKVATTVKGAPVTPSGGTS